MQHSPRPEITHSVLILTPNRSERNWERRRRRIITRPCLDDSKTTWSLFPGSSAKNGNIPRGNSRKWLYGGVYLVKSVSPFILVAKTHESIGLTRGGTAWIMRLPIRILLHRSMMSLYSCDSVVLFGFWASSCQRCCGFSTLCMACVN